MNPTYKEILSKIFKFGLAGGLIYWLIQSGVLDLSRLGVILARPAFMVIFLLLVGGIILVNHMRWFLLIRGQGIDRSIWETLPLTYIGVFFNYAIPGSVGGDVVKAYYIAKDSPNKKLKAIFTVGMDRFIGLLAMLSIATTTLLLNSHIIGRNAEIATMASVLYVVSSAVFLFVGFLLFAPRAEKFVPRVVTKVEFIKKMIDTFLSYRTHKKYLLFAYLMSLCSQMIAVSCWIVVGHALGEMQIPTGAYFFAVPLGFISTAIPIAPAGIGVGQVAFHFLFQAYTDTSDLQTGQLGITVLQVVQLVWGCLGVYFYLRRKAVIADQAVVDKAVVDKAVTDG